MSRPGPRAERVWRRPPVAPPATWQFPQPETSTLPNGMRLLLLDRPGQHVLALRVVLGSPVSHEEPGTQGSTQLMVRCLDEGTTGHTAEELADQFERHGIAWGAGAGERGVHLGADVTAHHLAAALDLVTECLAEPTFPEQEVVRLRRHRLTDIAHDRSEPGARAALEFIAAYFDERDRPHVPLGGNRWSVGAITPDHLRDRHAALGPTGGTVILVGDLSTVADAAGLAAGTIGAWTGCGEQPPPPGPARRAARAGGITGVPMPGLPQTDLYLGRPGPDRRTPHGWGTYQAAALLLGGSPHARLDTVLREERGYTYGVRLGFRPRSVGGLCVVGGSVRADATLPAVQEMLRVLDAPGSDLREQEVREAADYLAMTAPGRYLTADAVADELVSLVGDGLPPDTVSRTLADLAGLTADRVAAAWEAVRTGPGWTVVAVGDPEHLATLDAVGLGELRPPRA